MSYEKILHRVLPLDFPQSNSTSSGSVSAQLFESIIPGYGPVHKFILVTFGIDITLLVTLFGTFWAICKLGHYVFMTFYSLVAENYMSSVHISNYDDIFDHLMKWLSEQPKIKKSRSLMAETVTKSAWEEEDENYDTSPIESTGDDTDFVPVLNFSNQEAKAPPRFIPAFGTHKFWHKGTYFILHRVQSTVFEERGSIAFAEKENITLSCFGRSAQPIKDLLQDAKDFYLQGHNAKTVIRRPSPKELRRWGGRNCWTQIAHRPCRPMETVVLDKGRKEEVLRDINEYLHPATPRYYANRGLPYRRGYLLHGPPGCGKTSLSFALAGVFGLDIYVISLLEPTLTEEDLGQLFTSLPRRCIVLLEDIDTAGLIRAEKSDEDEKKKNATGKEDFKIADFARELKKANKESEEEKKKGISLSGLLNAIDGVASHEGRVLIMTTNKPEKLDDALIRPGRVDLQVAFGYATQSQVKELFERMYISDRPRHRGDPGSLAAAKPGNTSLPPSGNGKVAFTVPKSFSSPFSLSGSNKPAVLTPPATPTVLSPTSSSGASETIVKAEFGLEERTLEECALEFASKIPDDKFSPAEIQGFLLKRKKSPQKACKDIERWVESMLEQKANKTKVLEVQ